MWNPTEVMLARCRLLARGFGGGKRLAFWKVARLPATPRPAHPDFRRRQVLDVALGAGALVQPNMFRC